MEHTGNAIEPMSTGISATARWRALLTGTIVVVSAVASFAAVRAWRAPNRTAAALARLTVDSQPAGAELIIDEQPRGTTPQTVSLDAGTHTLGVRAAGVERMVRVTLAPGAHVEHHFELAATPAQPGRLSIVTDPPGARITVDGRASGVSPLMMADLAVGEHVVKVESDTGSAQRTIAVAGGITNDVLFSLPRAKAPVGGWVLVSSPFPVDLIEGGDVLGTSASAKVMLAAGRHNLTLRNEALGYAAPRTIDVPPGAVVRLSLVPPQARVNINARPWADVTIDGKAAGQTPLANVSLAIGPHQITFQHPQLGERTERVTVAADRANRFAVDLTR